MYISSIYIILTTTIFVQVSSGRPNILFIGADDLRPNLAAYKDGESFLSPEIHSPNLDTLAAGGLVFENAYCQYAICGPSRTSVLTGRRPDTTQVVHLDSYFREEGGNFTTLPQFFKESGYYSLSVGKIFHPSAYWHPCQGCTGDDDEFSWDEVFHAPVSEFTLPNTWPDLNTEYYDHAWRSFSPEELSSKPLQDTYEANWLIKKLRSVAPDALLGTTPFFIGWGLNRPHLPFAFPEEFLSFYPEDSISLPDNPYVPEGMPDQAWSNFGELRSYKDCKGEALGVDNLGEINVTLPDWKTKELRRGYYAAVSYIDAEIGRVLEELDILGLSENTVVVFWGDHGWQLGEHAEWSKHTNFEIAARVPLILRVPDMTVGRTDGLVELVDLFPTLVEVAGFPPLSICHEDSKAEPLCREGSSLLPLVSDPQKSDWKDAVFWQYSVAGGGRDSPHKMGYCVRTERYRYTEWVSVIPLEGSGWLPDWDSLHAAELYDLKDDPEENWNKAEEESYQEDRKTLSDKLHAGWRSALPNI